MTDGQVFSSRRFQRAIEIATRAHEGQTDKAGMPYILHPLRVGLSGRSDAEKIVGFLHDTVEDSRRRADACELVTFGMLIEAGFAEDLVTAIDALTKREGEPYLEYLDRVKENPLARAVKLNDLEDNLREDRWAALSDAMMKRYLKARRFLKDTDE